jgi:hypothetical protein
MVESGQFLNYRNESLFRILCRWQKQADFLSVFAFLKAHSRCYATEKGEKWRKMSRF